MNSKPYTRPLQILVLTIAVILMVATNASYSSANPISSKMLALQQNNAAQAPQIAASELTELKLGQPIERELAGGAVHRYSIKLEANQYLNAVVEQKGIDVVVSVYNPNGEKIYEVDSPNGTDGPEPVYLITPVAGVYRLEVVSLEKEAKPGKYEAKLAEVRASLPSDTDRVAGFKALGEAVLLQSEGKPDSTQSVIKKYEEAIDKLERTKESLAQVNALNNLGNLYKAQGNYKMAESPFIQALKICEQFLGGDNPNMANSLNNVEKIYQDKGDYDTGSYKVKVGEYLFLKAQSMNNLGLLYYEKGDVIKAIPLHLKSLEIFKKVRGENHPDTIASINNLALIYTVTGDYEKAEPLLLQALEIRKLTLGENHPDTAISINNLAQLYYIKGNYTKAEILFLQALEIYEKSIGQNNITKASLINNLAQIYGTLGNYEKAEQRFIQALEIRKQVLGEKHPDIATSIDNLAGLYFRKGDYSKAVLLYLQALEIRKTTLGETNLTTAKTINNLAQLYQAQGDYEKANPLLVQALEIHKQVLGEKHPDTATSINNLAQLYQAQGDYEKAKPLLMQALEMRKQVLGENNPDTATSINNLALLYKVQGDYEKAESLFIQSLEIDKKVLGENHPGITKLKNNLSLMYQAKGNIGQAIKYSWQANDEREKEINSNLSLGSERQKQLYLQLYANELDNTLSLHVQLAPKDLTARQSALTQILRRKGRSIDAVNQSIEALRKRSTPEDIALLDELTAKKAQLSNLTIQGLGKRTPDEYQQQLKAIQDEVEKLEYQISQRSAEFLVQAQPITLQAVQQAVPSDATLVEFASYHTFDAKTNKYGTRRYVVYLLNNQGEPQWADLGEAEPIDQLVDELRTKLRSKETDVEKEIKPLARRLDELVMQPVTNLTGKGKRLLVAPDGKLNLVPFAALVDEQGKFLVENYDISYLTSGRDLLRLQVKIDSKQAPVIIGDPDFGPFPQAKDIKEGSTIFARLGFKRLASTELEAKAIKEIFPNGQLLLQDKATELALDNINAPSILHIATHGFFLEEKDTVVPDANSNRQLDIIGADANRIPANLKIENPLLRSGLALAGANLHTSDQDNQGIFTALKTTALNLWGTKVVVLSACDTGVGEVKTGDGIYGLRRALVLAGSETQLMSLWPVSDAGTKELMVSYYQRLQKGEGRAEGLRQVQLELLKSKTHQHPFYWASFIQSGEWANLAGKR